MNDDFFALAVLLYINPIHTGLLWMVYYRQGFPPLPCNSFVFEVTDLKFSTKLLLGKNNILQQQKSRSSG